MRKCPYCNKVTPLKNWGSHSANCEARKKFFSHVPEQADPDPKPKPDIAIMKIAELRRFLDKHGIVYKKNDRLSRMRDLAYQVNE